MKRIFLIFIAAVAFYNRVWPKNHPFWQHNQPGNLWNCKCDWEQTDDPATDGNPQGQPPHQGLEGNPAVTGEVFTDKHNYIKGAGEEIRKTVEKFCDFVCTPETDKPRLRWLQKEVKKSFAVPSNPRIKSKESYTRHLYFGRDDFDCLIGHCFEGEEIFAVQKIDAALLSKLKNGRYEPLNTSRKNIRKKINAGVIYFVAYDVEIDGVMYELKTEAIKDKNTKHNFVTEHPYALKKKKPSEPPLSEVL